jgi:soluble lytic murein transglycosylase-like protein
MIMVNKSTMKTIIMVIALGLACAGCQTTGSNGADYSNLPLVRLVTDKAQERTVPPKLANAVVKVESGYNPKARSKGNYGLGQIRCGTAKGVGFTGNCRDLLNPEINLTYSMEYLALALDAAGGDWCNAATVYNNGLGARPRPSRYCRKVLNAVDNQELVTEIQ